MSREKTSDLLTQYVTVLREFGLPREDIRELHSDGSVPEELPLRRLLDEQVETASPDALFTRLVETLTQSRRGINATASYWNYAPEVHLNEVFEPYGCTVTFRDASHGGDGATFEIEVEDSSNNSHRLSFEYPDTPLGDDNFPALVRAIERELLEDTHLTFVLLSAIDRRWRLLLLEEDRLETLRERHGERVEFLGRPLLREDQLDAFARGEATRVRPGTEETVAGTGDDRSTARLRPRERHQEDLLVDVEDDLAGGSDPEAVFAGTPEDLIEETPTDDRRTAAGGVEASDRDLKQVFGDLSDVSLDPTDQSADAAAPDAADADPDASPMELGTEEDALSAADAEEGIDAVFEELEREAVTESYEGSTSGGGGGSALLVEEGEEGGTAADTDADAVTASTVDSDGSLRESTDQAIEEVLASVEQNPSEVVDVTAGELFGGLDGDGEAATAVDDGTETGEETRTPPTAGADGESGSAVENGTESEPESESESGSGSESVDDGSESESADESENVDGSESIEGEDEDGDGDENAGGFEWVGDDESLSSRSDQS